MTKPNQCSRAGWLTYYRELYVRTGRQSALTLFEWYGELLHRFGERRPDGVSIPLRQA